ncbi:alpha/beta fold hydrolase [Streptomyces sp. Pv4-95]|uniref:alpha/beta fold hydrolase n=1 Tax=Streptomyces sp. Pv4-95 TaxID=3049543 RepID=UPI003891A239
MTPAAAWPHRRRRTAPAPAPLDLRGTGYSDAPADQGSYRCDRQVADLEALRAHLGPDRVDAVAHSASDDRALL